MLCEYGCNQKAKFKIGKKWCCSLSINSCPEIRRKNSQSIKSKPKVICPICKKSFGSIVFSLHKKVCKINYCLWCKKEINRSKKFCNPTCAGFYNNRNNQRTEVKCINCNNTFFLNGLKKFCSAKCQQDYLHKIFIKDWLEGKISGTKVGGASNHVRRYLIEAYGTKCMKCGWNEENPYYKNIPIELHHKDGIWQHNRPENLELLCPNCHSLTKNYKFKNAGQGRECMKKYRYRYII